MRKRVMGFLLAVSMFLVLTPDTVMAARMEGTPLQVEKEAEQAEPEKRPETVPDAEVGTAVGPDMEGAGTETSPYRISNAQQLRFFADMVNGVGSEPNTGLCATLMCDIDLSDVCGADIGSWTPIGTSANPYTGTFSGGSFAIRGLYYHKAGTSYAGLFGRNAGTVKNLGIVGADIVGGNYTGGVCGYNNGIITGCYHAASVKGINDTGGICGYNDGGGTVSVCYNTGTVSGSKYVGGICGYNKNNAVDCYNMGPVTGDKTSIGGICGYNKASVSNCFNTGSVVGGGKKYIGSVCGYNHSKSTFLNCYYLITGEEKGNYGVAMPQERFASGEVCWLLNDGKSENVIWYQTCGAGFPAFVGKTVYQVQRQKAGGRADEMIVAYTNEKEKKQAANNVSAQENTSDQNSGDQAHEHRYQEPEWEWEEYKAAKAVFACQDCGEKIVLEAKIVKSEKEATCAAEGKMVYTASVEKDGKTYQDEKTVKSEKLPHQTPLEWISAKPETCEGTGISQDCWRCSVCGNYFKDAQAVTAISRKDVEIPAKGHNYLYDNDKKWWHWNKDSNPVTASLDFKCGNPGCEDIITEKAKVTFTTTATCTSAGETTYTAVVKWNGQSYEDKYIVSGQPIPHSYGDPVWTWADDYSKADAVFNCGVCSHSGTKTDNAPTKLQTRESTCETTGEIQYTAVVSFEGRDYSDVKTVTLEKTAHIVKDQPVWTWADDFTTASAAFTCDICKKEINIVEVKANIVEIPGTCSAPGKITYTATVKVDGKSYTDTKEKPMPAQHTLTTHVEAKNAKCEEKGNEEYWQCSVCHHYFDDADGKNEISKIPEIPATGHKLVYVEDKKYKCSVCQKTFYVTVASDGTTSITSVEGDAVIAQDAPTQVDSEEEPENAAPQSLEEQDGGNEAEPVTEETPPQPGAEEKQDENADQSVGERGTESSHEKQSEQNEENARDGQSENLDGIMDTSEHAARYGMIYPEKEAVEEEHAATDVWEENAIKLRAESKGNAVPQTTQAQQQSSLWRSVAALVVLAGAVLTLLYKGRSGNRK